MTYQYQNNLELSEWQAENKFALQATEWIQSIIGNKGLSSATRCDDHVFHSVRAF
jgi:roadblock/LC7 domain-containing protein